MGSKFCVKQSKLPFEISHKIFNQYTTKYAFYETLKIWRLVISLESWHLKAQWDGPQVPGVNKYMVKHSDNSHIVITTVGPIHKDLQSLMENIHLIRFSSCSYYPS